MDIQDSLALQSPRPDGQGARGLPGGALRNPRSPVGHYFARRKQQQLLDQELRQVRAFMAETNALDEAALTRRLQQTGESMRRTAARGQGLQRQSQRCLAMALVATTAGRILDMAATDAQLVAALAMGDAHAVRLPAGQGKTLAVGLAAVMAGWSSRCCHVVCATEPLALRDAIAMRPLFLACGLTVSVVTSLTPQDQFEGCYRADVVYGVARRFAADVYRDLRLFGGIDNQLRRRLLNASDPAQARRPMTRGQAWALVDDLDRVLIDEASMPLVISEPSENPLLQEAVQAAHGLVSGLEPGHDYRIGTDGLIEFTDAGQERLTQLQEHLPPLWRPEPRRDDLMKQAIVARDVLVEGLHYSVSEGKISFREDRVSSAVREKTQLYGLVQALEAHVGLPLSSPPRTVERISFQGFFRRYVNLGGVASDLSGMDVELAVTYGLSVLDRYATLAPGRKPAVTAPATEIACVGGEEQRHQLVCDTVRRWQADQASVLVCLRRPEQVSDLVALLKAKGIDAMTLTQEQDEDKRMSREEFLLAALGNRRVLVVPEGALTGDQLPVGAEGTAPAGLRLLLAESLGLVRAQTAFFNLGARQGGASRSLWIMSPEDTVLTHHLRWIKPVLKHLRVGGAAHRAVLRMAIAQAQRSSVRGGKAQRHQLLLRENSLRQQLSFAGSGRFNPRTRQDGLPSATNRPAETAKG